MTTTDRDRLIARILEAQRRMQHLFAADRSDPLFESHLTLPQLKILLLLSLHGGASGQDLARRVGVSLATMTGIVDRLSAQGLVARHEEPRDRRVKVVDLTPAGRAAIDKIITAGVERQRTILARLSTPDLEVVRRAVDLLIEAATEDADAAAAEDQAIGR